MIRQGLHHARILIADDEPANIALLEGLLSAEGYRNFRSTSDAREVLAMVDAEQPDLILLDLHMPYLSGFEIMSALKETLPPELLMPILVLTADATSDAKERALAGGARDFLTKPIDGVEVGLRIRNLLEVRQLHRLQMEARATAERAAARARLLADASHVLASSFDYHTTLSQLARLLVSAFGELCVVVVDRADETRVAGLAHAEPDVEAALRAALEAPGSQDWLPPLLDRLRTGSTGTHSADEAAHVAGLIPDGAAPGLSHALRTGAAMLAPIRGSSGPLGTVVLVRSGEERHPDDEVALAEEIAYRAGVAVENAWLYQQAQQATRARDEMLGVVAHDLRNPLNAIGMSGEHLLDMTPADDTERREPLGLMLRAVQTMNRLIEDLLEVRRMETQGIRVERSEVDMAAVIRQAAEMLAPLAKARRIELVATASELPRLMADAPRLQQVISNLVGNALKFTRAGGRIEIGAEAGAEEVVVSIRDSGAGIAPDQLPHVFQRFWQAGGSDRRGIGLGLAIARGIVEAHSGRIWVESELDVGSTFSFTLPLSVGVTAPSVGASSSSQSVVVATTTVGH